MNFQIENCGFCQYNKTKNTFKKMNFQPSGIEGGGQNSAERAGFCKDGNNPETCETCKTENEIKLMEAQAEIDNRAKIVDAEAGELRAQSIRATGEQMHRQMADDAEMTARQMERFGYGKGKERLNTFHDKNEEFYDQRGRKKE